MDLLTKSHDPLNGITNVSGIYKIINKINKKYYVGSASTIRRRLSKHIWDFRNARHDNKHLFRAFRKYGIENFNFIICEECPVVELELREQDYLNIAEREKEKCYNMIFQSHAPRGPYNPMYGKKHSQETKQKIGEKSKKRYFSPECRRLQGLHRSGIKNGMFGRRGKNSVSYDCNIYKFKYIITGEIFEGTRFDFYTKYNLYASNITLLVQGKRKSVNDWILAS